MLGVKKMELNTRPLSPIDFQCGQEEISSPWEKRTKHEIKNMACNKEVYGEEPNE